MLVVIKTFSENFHGFKWSVQTSIDTHTHTHTQCSHASVGLAQAHPNYSLQKLHKRASPNSLAMLEAFPYFEGRSLILVQNIRQGKHFFCALVCCIGSTVYLAGQHVKKSGLELKIPRSEAHFLQILLKVYTKHQIYLKCQPSNYRVVVQEKISGSNSRQVIWCKECLSSAASCWFKCVEAFLNRNFLSPNNIFMCCWTVTCLRFWNIKDKKLTLNPLNPIVHF